MHVVKAWPSLPTRSFAQLEESFRKVSSHQRQARLSVVGRQGTRGQVLKAMSCSQIEKETLLVVRY